MNLREILRTLRWSTWLGWQIESNWADLRLFFLYMFVKPVSGSLVLVCMFFAADYAVPGRLPREFLPYIYVSNACFGLVGNVMFGMSYVVLSDRESYRMLKYVFISPAVFQTYFVGRGLARGLEGLVGGIIILSVGLALPQVREAVQFEGINIPWLLAFLAVGSVMIWSCGMLLGAAALNLSRSGMFLSEGISGVVYLLSGVVYPLTVLPKPAQYVGMALPTTQWLEGMRRALVGHPPEGSPLAQSPLATWTEWELLGSLVASTIVLVVVSQWFYRWSVRRAWRLGKLEETSGM